MLKKLGSYLPHLSIAIIVLSLIKTFLYYLNFNVPIKYFISLSELGLAIADDLLLVVPLALVFFLYDHFFRQETDLSKYVVDTSKLTEQEIQRIDKSNNRIKRNIKRVFIIIEIGLFIFGITQDVFSDKIVIFMLFIGLIFMYIILFKNEKLGVIISSGNISTSIYVFIFFILFGLKIESDISGVVKGKKFTGTIIKTADSTYTSTDSAYYIGQTEKYIFFFNEKDKHTTVIPDGEVKKLELYSK